MTPMLKRIMIANGIVWLVELVTRTDTGLGDFVEHMALTPAAVYPGLELWQPFTYMWLHSQFDYWHIVLNMLFLWMFGGTLEIAWGSKAFLRFYLLCGVGAGLVVFALGVFFSPTTPVLGASGAIYGLIIAWAIVYPNRIIYFFGLFPIKGKHFVLFPIGIAVLEFLTRSQGVSHASHLGGMAIGALLVTGFWRPAKAVRWIRYLWARRKIRLVYDSKKNRPSKGPPDGGYWH
jgi:membrane associated rhomboid family serine protease